MEFEPGSTLGRYELLVPIAVGGMARVWAARLRGVAGFSKLVAVKMILPELAEDTGFQEMFMDEARIASLVHHPNVCETYDLAETNGVLYLAMEWVDGTSLLRILRSASVNPKDPTASVMKAPLDPRISARIIADSCAGLHAAHELVGDDGQHLCVIHRDATPHNILITADGRIKMSDFGVAKAAGQAHATLAGQIKGKVPYMAPEQLTGDPADRRADIFALGVCLYECVTGMRAYTGDSDPEIMSKIILGNVEPPRSYAPSLPPALEAVILRAMKLDQDERFPTAEAMQIALEQYLAQSGPPVMQSALAALVRARCGAEVEERREKVRAAVAGTGPSSLAPRSGGEIAPASRRSAEIVDAHATNPMASPPVHDTNPAPPPTAEMMSALGHHAAPPNAFAAAGARPPARSDASGQLNGAMDLKRSAAPQAAARWGIVALVCVFGALVGVGAGGFAYMKMHKSAEGADTKGLGPPIEIPTVVMSSPLSSAPAQNMQNTNGAHAPSTQVHFKIDPPASVLVVDGVALPMGTNIVQRRTDGVSQSVLIRAEKHDDYVVIIDADTPAELDVVLTPLEPGQAPNGGDAPKRRPRPKPDSSASPASSGAAAPAASDTVKEAPPNPYGGE
jgi:serine/threonine-protein kinase